MACSIVTAGWRACARLCASLRPGTHSATAPAPLRRAPTCRLLQDHGRHAHPAPARVGGRRRRQCPMPDGDDALRDDDVPAKQRPYLARCHPPHNHHTPTPPTPPTLHPPAHPRHRLFCRPFSFKCARVAPNKRKSHPNLPVPVRRATRTVAAALPSFGAPMHAIDWFMRRLGKGPHGPVVMDACQPCRQQPMPPTAATTTTRHTLCPFATPLACKWH